MTGALIWKEWRQQRSLVFAALAAALVLPLFTFFGSFGRFRFDSLTQVLPALQMIVLLPVFAAATGALCFADDRSENTLGFLLSRPTSRARVWVVKVGTAFGIFLVIAVLTLGVSMLLGTLVGGPTMEELVPSRPLPPGVQLLGGGGMRSWLISSMSQATGRNPVVTLLALTVTGPGFLLVLFGSSVFWSTRSARPLHAMLAGILTTMVLVAGQTAMALLALQTNVRPPLYTQWPLMVCAALLVASFLSFRASDPATT